MPTPLVRTSLITQTVHALRESIKRGDYGNHLLPERVLSIELGVSRPTLRAALLQLQKEGFLAVNNRQIRTILRPRPRATRGGVVRLLQDNAPSSWFNEHLQNEAYLAEHLRGPGIEFHVETSRSCYAGNPSRALERLVQSRPAHLWLLYQTTAPMQRWFQKKRIPCVVLGSCHPGINFPSIDEDYRSICRHAVGLLLSRRHRRLVALIAKVPRPGDRASIKGFEEGVACSSEKKIEYRVAMHDGTVPGICKTVKQLMSLASPPSGWLIMNASTYITVSSYLARRGIFAGREISMICRNSDPYLSALVPSVAHYQRKMQMMNHRLLEIVNQTLAGQTPRRQHWLINSEFKNGESLYAMPEK